MKSIKKMTDKELTTTYHVWKYIALISAGIFVACCGFVVYFAFVGDPLNVIGYTALGLLAVKLTLVAGLFREVLTNRLEMRELGESLPSPRTHPEEVDKR